jgi:hypothetical protein
VWLTGSLDKDCEVKRPSAVLGLVGAGVTYFHDFESREMVSKAAR